MRTLRPALAHHTSVLKEEIQVLRGQKDVVGSDLRFPFYARRAGYQLWGDASVRCGHMLEYPLSPDDFSGLPESVLGSLQSQMKKRVLAGRREWRKGLRQYE